jgi:5-oxoprolinase (ATP-hydrolysing)
MEAQSQQKWSFWIDRGGTFTDIVAKTPDSGFLTCKLLSENPAVYADAAIAGIRQILAVTETFPLTAACVADVKMGTTVATNALLERKGEPTALLVTKGFADILRIGYQTRPDIFALNIVLPEMLYCEVIEVQERVAADGKIVEALNQKQVTGDLNALFQQGIRSLAIVLLHAYQYPQHEKQIEIIARKIGFQQISVSHVISPLIKVVRRGDTTVIDAYLTPVLQRYVSHLKAELNDIPLLFMQSNGGLTDAKTFCGKNAILSGPAGGVVGMVKTAKAEGFDRLIGFDMGGTSTDVSHYAGDYERTFETQVSAARVATPMMYVHTVAAGGGSVLSLHNGRFQVGPDSAGANPGPACYRNNGPLTVTDCHVLLGRIQPVYFPAVFGLSRKQLIDPVIVRQKFTGIQNDLLTNAQENKALEEIAQGYFFIAVENMANAIRKISVQRGYDLADYVLCGFGGAGGQHVCAVATSLGMKKIFLHRHAGVLSAFGIGLAERREIIEKTVNLELTEGSLSILQIGLDKLQQQAVFKMTKQGLAVADINVEKKCMLHYRGSDSSLLVSFGTLEIMQNSFQRMYKKLYGMGLDDRPIIVLSLYLEAFSEGASLVSTTAKPDQPQVEPEFCQIYLESGWQSVPVYHWRSIIPEAVLLGPVLIIEPNSTTVVEKDWSAVISLQGNLVLTRIETYSTQSHQEKNLSHADPVMLEMMNNLFMSVAEEMGTILEKTASSVNIKERLDFSCALFDDQGNLIANAPHIPVHLGSMSDSIKVVIDQCQPMVEGDVFVLNSPYQGGTHLPDITVVKPVFAEDCVVFYVAARGHHADVGGISPGSMPASSQHIAEEGILIEPMKLVSAGVFQASRITELLSSGEYPARNIEQNIVDLKAQIAACEKGLQGFQAMFDKYGLAHVQAYVAHVFDHAELAVKQLLASLPDGKYRCQTDSGSQIQVAIKIDREALIATIDFSGCSPQQAGNFNAPSAICKAAVLYVFRCLVTKQMVLNAGFFRPLRILIPEQSLLSPEYPAAVVAGNVETSQAIVDALFAALGVLSGSQGTCNNLAFGNEQYQYYETLCGGAGAGDGFHGASAVHTHMTNSRLTDPEILETRFPVLLRRFEIRQNSGGAGKYHGGEGVVREIQFLQDMHATIISSHREIACHALNGGEPGALGRNKWVGKNKTTRRLAGCDQLDLNAGDIIKIETPGGGGFGAI